LGIGEGANIFINIFLDSPFEKEADFQKTF